MYSKLDIAKILGVDESFLHDVFTSDQINSLQKPRIIASWKDTMEIIFPALLLLLIFFKAKSGYIALIGWPYLLYFLWEWYTILRSFLSKQYHQEALVKLFLVRLRHPWMFVLAIILPGLVVFSLFYGKEIVLAVCFSIHLGANWLYLWFSCNYAKNFIEQYKQS